MTDQETFDALQGALTSVEDAMAQLAQLDGMDQQMVMLSALAEELDEQLDELESIMESGYDGQPDEAQEWHDFDPDC